MDFFCEKLRSIEGVIDFERRGDLTVDVGFDVGVPMLKVIKEIISLVSKCGLDLMSLNSSTSRIEDAFLKLLEEEESRGFLRAVKP